MPPIIETNRFWQYIAQLLQEHEVVIDRPKGSPHPRYPDLIYPLDYGYLAGTSSMDQGGIDVWRGSASGMKIMGIFCTVDLLKADSEIKIVLNCSDEEITAIHKKHNEFSMAGLWIPNPFVDKDA